MSFLTGTASDHQNLFDQLVNFLSTDSTLTGLGQNWTVLRAAVQLPFTSTLPNGRICFTPTPSGNWPDMWPNTVPSTVVRFAITGSILAPADGTYQFSLNHVGEVEAIVDSVKVFGEYNDNAPNLPNTADFTLSMTSGSSHLFEIRYINWSRNPSPGIRLMWKKPGDNDWSFVPATNLLNTQIQWNSTYGRESANAGTPAGFAAEWSSREVIIRGPGLSNTDQIFLGLITISNSGDDVFNIGLTGMTGYDPTKTLDNQPGRLYVGQHLVGYKIMPLWGQAMKFWFIANGRRFMAVAKVSTNYENLYGGFIIPNGLPSEIPYPLAIGGSSTVATDRFSQTNWDHGSFFNPSINSDPSNGTLSFRHPNGTWEHYVNQAGGSAPNGRVYPSAGEQAIRSAPNGDYALEPLVMYTPDNGGNAWGELDGVYHISGYGNASENTLVINGDTYVVMQAAHRNGIQDYAAFKLA